MNAQRPVVRLSRSLGSWTPSAAVRHPPRGPSPARSLASSRRTPPCLPLPLPSVPSCPVPTRAHRDTPALPPDLPIDCTTDLRGLIPSYTEQVIICTGHAAWPSRIEDELGLASGLKALLGRGGELSDPFHNISVLNSSFAPSPSVDNSSPTVSAYIFPTFQYLPAIALDNVRAFAEHYLLPDAPHAAHEDAGLRARLSRRPAPPTTDVRDVHDIVVLICGHGSRDGRCGLLGPVLRDEFNDQLAAAGFTLRTGPAEDRVTGEAAATSPVAVRVGLVSHVGGHKFAGNIILYLPPSLRLHPLAGRGIWYGRVEPRHVEGIVCETVQHGRVIETLLRGAIDAQRTML